MIKEIIAQCIGIVAMAFIILSFQQKKPRNIIAMQLVGSFLFSINFFMIEAYVGALSNAIGAVRGVIYYFKEKTHADKWYVILAFSLVFALVYPLTFTVFGKPFNLLNALVELLPIIAMIISTISFSKKDAKTLRILNLICSPCWLIYDIVVFTLGGVICEVLSLISIITAIVRHDLK